MQYIFNYPVLNQLTKHDLFLFYQCAFGSTVLRTDRRPEQHRLSLPAGSFSFIIMAPSTTANFPSSLKSLWFVSKIQLCTEVAARFIPQWCTQDTSVSTVASRIFSKLICWHESVVWVYYPSICPQSPFLSCVWLLNARRPLLWNQGAPHRPPQLAPALTRTFSFT